MQMNWSIGFGFERIGLLVLRFPRVATLLLLASIIFSAASLSKLSFDGDVVNVLNTQGEAFKNYQHQSTSFHDYTKDVAVILQHTDFNTVEVFEGLRELHLDLSLEEGIDSVYSVFTVADATALSDSDDPLLPASFGTDDQVNKSLAKLLIEEPATRAIVSPEQGAMLMMIGLADSEQLSETELGLRLNALRAVVAELAPANTNVSFSGMPQIRVSIVEAIVSDQTLLTGSGIILGCLVAWFIFGTIRSALLCTAPAFLAVLWILGAFATSNTSLSFFTTALPTLALIIAFADTIVLYFRWQALNDDVQQVESGSKDSTQFELTNLAEAVRQVGPASSLTSITTALAFASFAWAQNPTMDQFAVFGVISVVFAFLGVIIGLPLGGYWATKLKASSASSKEQTKSPRFTGSGNRIANLVCSAPKLVALASVVMVVAFSWTHSQLKASYTLSEYFPKNSEIRDSEAYADSVFGGTAQYFAVLPVTQNGSFHDQQNRQRLLELEQKVAGIFGKDKTLSLVTAWRRMTEEQIIDMPEALDEAPRSLSGRFVSDDRRYIQVSATTSSSESTLKVDQPIQQLEQSIAELPFADEVSITGLRVLMSQSFPVLIEDLRSGLLVSIFLAVLVVAVATRSIALAAASLIPNLVPILFAQSVMWLFDASLSVTNVIALTIAFGISIDNAVHVINAYKSISLKMAEQSLDCAQRVHLAVAEISPALIASTCIVCVAAIITQFSSMPTVTELGLLLIATLIVALISNLAILPSMMIILLRITQNKNSF